MKNNELSFPKMNLQFFAADQGTEQEAPETETTNEPDSKPELSVEDQLQQMRVEQAKMKKALDKASSEAADYKKKYNATLSESEQKKQEEAEKQAERDEQFNKLLKENTVTKLEKNFMALGYPEELANKAANAQYENDTDELFKIQSQAQQAIVKAKESEWLRKRPEVTTGAGDGNVEDPFVKGFNS